MKNKIYIIGLISPLLIIMGGVFKTNHWAGASILLLLGIFTLCVIFLPAAVISGYKDNSKKRGLLYIAIFLTIFTDFVGALFKLMHWPGAGKLLIFGITFPVIIFLPVYLYYHYKEHEESQANFLYIMFLLVYLSVMSALLSLNVSREFINGTLVSEYASSLNDYYSVKTKNRYYQMQTTSESAKNYITKTLNKHTNVLINEIDEINKEMILLACQCNNSAIDINKINLFKIEMKDNNEVPGMVMIGKGRAKSLKENIQNYKTFLHQFANDKSSFFNI